MSRLKFRQKLKPEYVKSYGESFHYWGFVGGGFISPMGKNETIGESGQFTGLTDKNGVEIFENDLIELESNKNGCLRVIFKNAYVGGWVLAEDCNHEHYVSLGARKKESVEVIGNIHQNQELLEQAK